MRTTSRALSVAIITGGLAVGPASAALAQQVCDAYSGKCTQVQGNTFQRAPQVEGNRSTRGTTLPFTGGEIVLMSVTGLGAVGAGTALVVAGRRRRASTGAPA